MTQNFSLFGSEYVYLWFACGVVSLLKISRLMMMRSTENFTSDERDHNREPNV